MRVSTENHPVLDRTALEKMASGLKALAHPVRLAVVNMLREEGSSRTVTEIYESLQVDQAVASQHLGVLREGGIVMAKRKGKHTHYMLKNRMILEVLSLMAAHES